MLKIIHKNNTLALSCQHLAQSKTTELLTCKCKSKNPKKHRNQVAKTSWRQTVILCEAREHVFIS